MVIFQLELLIWLIPAVMESPGLTVPQAAPPEPPEDDAAVVKDTLPPYTEPLESLATS